MSLKGGENQPVKANGETDQREEFEQTGTPQKERRIDMTHHEVLKDKDYNLVSTLYHALQGVETTGVYLRDAESAGDNELNKYFRETQNQYRQLAEGAKRLLSKRIQ
jgi:hypothetical protein